VKLTEMSYKDTTLEGKKGFLPGLPQPSTLIHRRFPKDEKELY